MTADGQALHGAAAVAVAHLEGLSAAAREAQELLAELVELVGFRKAALYTGLPLGTLQRWVVGLPVMATLDAARQRRDELQAQG